MDDLQQYVEEQRAEGALDSSGVFSLAPERAIGRFRGFQQAEPAFWLLRLAQALNRAGATQVRFKLQKHRLRMEADNAPGLSGGALYSALRGGSQLPAMQHLVVSFLAGLTLNSKRLVWRSEGEEVLWEGGECSLRTVKSRTTELEWVPFYPLDSAQLADLHGCISHRLAVGPEVLMLDGRRIGPDWPVDKSRNQGLRLLVSERARTTELGFRFPFHDLENYQRRGDSYVWANPQIVNLKQRTNPCPPLVYQPMGEHDRFHHVCGLVLSGDSSTDPVRLYLVRDGVVADLHRLDWGVPAVVMADARQLRFDASGLKVVEDETFAGLQDLVGRELISCLDAVENNLDHAKLFLSTAVPSAVAAGSGLLRGIVKATLSPLMSNLISRQLPDSFTQELAKQIGLARQKLTESLSRISSS